MTPLKFQDWNNISFQLLIIKGNVVLSSCNYFYLFWNIPTIKASIHTRCTLVHIPTPLSLYNTNVLDDSSKQ